jgi:hypothetical protein
MACKIARSHRLRLLPLGISQEQGVRKETKDDGGLETEHQDIKEEVVAILPTMLQ